MELISHIDTFLKKEAFQKWSRLILSYLLGQGAVQLIQVLTGFFLLRWLSIEQYAQYTTAFAFQATAQNLVELGFAGAIVALVGNRTGDKALIGQYIKGGKFYRDRLFILVGLISVILFPLLTWKHGWAQSVTLALLLAILANLYFSGWGSFYSAPFRIQSDIKGIYRIEIQSSVIRFLLITALFFTSTINAWLVVWIGSLQIFLNGWLFKKRGTQYFKEPSKADPLVRKEMWKYIAPIMPGLIYAAFQAQIMVFIISIFGESRQVAEVGALGRLSQLFMLLNMAGGMLIGPYLARQARDRHLLKKYLRILGFAVGIAVILVLVGFLLPEPLLWLMGDQYAHLTREVGILVLDASILFINGLMWTMNCSRKWLWWWIPVISISTNVLLQIILIGSMDLSTTYQTLIFSLILSVFHLFNKIIVLVVGIRKGPSAPKSTPTTPSES
ncbi:MAG: hypothetical protein AAFR61_03730 [Bacteroidota bacterium]